MSVGISVCDEKVCVTKNEHFLKMCHGGQLEPPLSDEKVCLTKNKHFLKMCQTVAWDPRYPI